MAVTGAAIIGFGAVNLKNVLPLADGSGLDPNKMLFVYDNLMVRSCTNWTFSIDIPTVAASLKGHLKVTLVWIDPPPSPISNKALVHNIDLLVVTPSMKGFWGNGKVNGDSVNPVEQVLSVLAQY